jgi:hypothetical protein
MFFIYVGTICNFYLTRRQMIVFLNWGGECLLRGTHWVFILDRMRFVFNPSVAEWGNSVTPVVQISRVW